MFLYRLAAHLRIVNVEELKDRITMDQVMRWVAYYRVEPFGDEWRRTARAAVIIAQAYGAKLAPDFEDKFLPSYDPNRIMTDAEILAELMKIPGAKLTSN